MLSTPFSCSRNENAIPIAVAGSTYGRKTIAWYWRLPRMRSLSTSAIARPSPSMTGTVSSSFRLFEERLAELRVVDDALVVVEPDPDRRVEVARVEAVAHDLHEREAEREGHRADAPASA